MKKTRLRRSKNARQKSRCSLVPPGPKGRDDEPYRANGASYSLFPLVRIPDPHHSVKQKFPPSFPRKSGPSIPRPPQGKTDPHVAATGHYPCCTRRGRRPRRPEPSSPKAPLWKGGRLRAPPVAEEASKKEGQRSKFCERMRAENFGYRNRDASRSSTSTFSRFPCGPSCKARRTIPPADKARQI